MTSNTPTKAPTPTIKSCQQNPEPKWMHECLDVAWRKSLQPHQFHHLNDCIQRGMRTYTSVRNGYGARYPHSGWDSMRRWGLRSRASEDLLRRRRSSTCNSSCSSPNMHSHWNHKKVLGLIDDPRIMFMLMVIPHQLIQLGSASLISTMSWGKFRTVG